MDDTLMSEEYEEGEGDYGTSGILTLDGQAWKNRDNTTYNSLLDINGVTDLFSQESTDQYNDRKQESYMEQIRLSRNRDYSRSEEDYSTCFVMAEIIFVLLFFIY